MPLEVGSSIFISVSGVIEPIARFARVVASKPLANEPLAESVKPDRNGGSDACQPLDRSRELRCVVLVARAERELCERAWKKWATESAQLVPHCALVERICQLDPHEIGDLLRGDV